MRHTYLRVFCALLNCTFLQFFNLLNWIWQWSCILHCAFLFCKMYTTVRGYQLIWSICMYLLFGVVCKLFILCFNTDFDVWNCVTVYMYVQFLVYSFCVCLDVCLYTVYIYFKSELVCWKIIFSINVLKKMIRSMSAAC